MGPGPNGNTLELTELGIMNDVYDEAAHSLRTTSPVDNSASKSITFDAGISTGKIATKASGTLTSTGVNVANNATVTIDTHVYTFKTILTGAADEVFIGLDAATSLDNLKSAVMDTGTAGVNYGTGTVAHTTVDATTNTDTTQLFVAKSNGLAGNLFATTETSSVLSFGATTLTGGSDGTVPLFTITGTVLISIMSICGTTLVGASATHRVGNSTTTNRYEAQVTATNIVATDIIDITGEVSAGTAPVITPTQAASTQSVIATIGTASITAGQMTYYAFWKPLSSGATVVAA